MSLAQAAAALLCLGLLGTVTVPGLTELRERMSTSLCANNLRAGVQAWNVYAAVNADAWMHIWDRSVQTTMLNGGNTVIAQCPYTLWYYVKGEIPPGPAYKAGQGWWNYQEQSYGGDIGPYLLKFAQPENNPQNHCPVTSEWAYTHWKNYTTYAIPIYTRNYGTPENPSWRNTGGPGSESPFYPKPSLFTHPATTLMVHDMGGSQTESYPNAWSSWNIYWGGQHGGKMNMAFCDGRVELLDRSAYEAYGEYLFRPYDRPPPQE